MTFDYSTLKKAAANGGKIGNWSGLPVFAISQRDMNNRGNGAYYVLYDDNNAFVRKMGETWFKYGYLDKGGNVHESEKEVYFKYKAPAQSMAAREEVKASTPTYVAPGPVGDVRVEIDVEAVLKKAREMTIEDLLEGFKYGL